MVEMESLRARIPEFEANIRNMNKLKVDLE